MDKQSFYSAANGQTYNGITVGSGYDCALRVVGTTPAGDTMVVGNIVRLSAGEEWLFEATYPAGHDMQRAAALLAANPPFDAPDFLVPGQYAEDYSEWDRLVDVWEAADRGVQS